MSRFCGRKNSRPILEAAEHWRNVALLKGNSVFGQGQLWTEPHLREIDRYFVQQPDLGKGTFLEKLQQQLSPTSSGAKRLVAEMMWVMYLCPSSLTPKHKLETIETIWSWSGSKLPKVERWLDTDVLDGIGSAGPGFNQNQWRELAFFTNLLLRFQEKSSPDREGLLKDPLQFDSWLKSIPDWRPRQFRHMVLYLLFPDSFERVFGGSDRRAIAAVFSGQSPKSINRLDPVQIDELFRDVRGKLETEYGTKDLKIYLCDTTLGAVAAGDFLHCYRGGDGRACTQSFDGNRSGGNST